MRNGSPPSAWARLARIYAHRLERRFAPTEAQRLFALTVLVGVVCGFVAVAFHLAIDAIAVLTVDRAMAIHGVGWVPWLVLTPALGGLVSGIVLHLFVPNARGSGIPQVKVAYARRGGRVRLRDAVGKFAVGAIQIGTGSSLGREGPTVQICAGVASFLARLSRISPVAARKLLPVGAAAGIAAAFNAPIAAVTFTIEEVVGALDQTLLSGIIVAAAFAAVIERSVLGRSPVFNIPGAYELTDASSLVLYAVLGVVAALVSLVFTESLLELRLWFRRHVRSIPAWVQPAVGSGATGALAVVAVATVHSGGVTGAGYDVLGEALVGKLPVRVLLVLCLAKLAATVLSYASGGAGGIFAPALFLGGMLGGAVGSLDVLVFHHPPSTLGAFALVGMGATFAGIVRAPITSVLIIIEMTSGYSLILPLMIANMISYGLARRVRPTPIYDALLEQDGIHLRGRGVLESLEGHPVSRLVSRNPIVAHPATGARELLRLASTSPSQHVVPVVDEADGRIVGMITNEEMEVLASEPALESLVTAADLMRRAVSIHIDEDLRSAFETMLSEELPQLPVVDATGHVVGIVDESTVARAYVRKSTREDPDEDAGSSEEREQRPGSRHLLAMRRARRPSDPRENALRTRVRRPREQLNEPRRRRGRLHSPNAGATFASFGLFRTMRMTMSRPRPHAEFDAAAEAFREGLARICRLYGQSPLLGRLYGELYLHDGPLPLDEICVRVGAAKSTVSVALRKLLAARVVRREPSRGDRRDRYEAVGDPWAVFADWARLFLAPELQMWRDTGGALERALHVAPPEIDRKALRARLSQMRAFAELMDALVEQVGGARAATARKAVTIAIDSDDGEGGP